VKRHVIEPKQGINHAINDVRIYRALSAEEVKALYEFEKP